MTSVMDDFCGSKFWDLSKTWNTEDPDFTTCFEQTVLVWIPCVFLWTFSSLEVFYILSSKHKDVPWNWLNISKLFITLVHCILTITDLATNVSTAKSSNSEIHNVEIYTPIVKLLSYGLSASLLYYNRRNGLQTSGLQFLFWLLTAICGAFQFRSEILNSKPEGIYLQSHYAYISYMIYYPLVLLMLLLNCFADRAPRYSGYPKVQNPCPEEGSSFLSRILFSWFDALAWKGYKNPLVDTDLWALRPEDTSNVVVPLFHKHWQQSLRKAQGIPPNQRTQVSFKPDSAHVEFSNSSNKKQASILPALVKSFGATFAFGSLMKLIQDLLTFVSPQVLRWLIDFVNNKDSLWKGFLYTAALFIAATVQTIVLSQYFNKMFIVGVRIRTALVSAIYRKALRISNSARKESTVGEIVNLMAVDAQRFVDLTTYLNMIWSAPLQIILALYFLWQILGASVLAGLAVMIILIPINGWIANKAKILQVKQMKNKDERVKLMNEVLSGMKVLKLYAWEPSFEKQILQIRAKEIKVLRQAAYLNAGTSFIWSCAPFLVSMLTFLVFAYSDSTNVLTTQIAFVSLTLFSIMRVPMALLPMVLVACVEVSLVSFATYVLVDETHVLDASTAFVSISLFNILRFPLSMLPMMISNMVQTAVSVGRINNFMNKEELDPTNVSHEPSEGTPLLIENGTFTWGEDPILKNINVRFDKNSLSAIVGTVGAGKSSLVSAFLGEMDKTSGRVNTNGSVAYVAQQAWIQNATLRDNVLFGNDYDKVVYDKVIEACALKPDFDMLPAGDQTEIGEKGINLSGGQKQRVSLARAVYANCDIYFLDDPLSAVDSHVGKHIFEHVIGPKGLLKHKTRVLVTHAITYLPQANQIIVLMNGEVSEKGTYQELLDKKGAFAEFLEQHITAAIEGDDPELEELTNQLGDSLITPEISKKLQRHRSRVSESVSETGSDKMNGSLNRQKSTDSSENNIRRRKSSTENSKSQTKIGEKLIETEKAETGSVDWNVYKHYLKSIGLLLTLTTLVLNMVFQGFSIGSNFWLTIWSNDTTASTDNAKRDMYLGVYGALGIGQVIFTSIASLALFVGTLNGATALHNLLLANIFRTPSTTFFDVTPTGRIINRFSKDVDVLDTVLPMTLRSWIICLYSSRQETGSANTFKLENVVSIWSIALSALSADLSLQLGAIFAARFIHQGLLGNIMRSPSAFFDVTPTGRILSRFSKDTDVVDETLPWLFSDGIYCFLEVLGTLFVISYSSPYFVIVIFVTGVLYFFIQRFYVATSRQLKRLESISRSPIYSHFGETITGASVIRAYMQQDRFIKDSDNKVDHNQIAVFPSMIANRWLAVRLESIGNLIILFAALLAVLGRDTISSGIVGLSISYALQITQTLNWLVRMTSDVETNIVAVERIKEYAEAPQEAPWDIPNKAPASTWPENGTVSFQDYSVRYRPGLDLVLRGVNFDIKGGEKIGIVGRTGAGKSSLTLSLFRIIEAAQGSISIDGVNIAEIGLHDLRSRLTIIPQDAVLFSGSLRMNLDPFDKHSDAEIWTSLEQAHLKAFVKGLPNGLTHEVSEGGDNLSVGQRQLICLSRALLRKTKVLVLDEATAAVDLETDDLIQSTIKQEFNNCTVLTIAHRLNTIMDSDRIIVLDKGVVAEFDTPAVLLTKDTIFKSMCRDAGLA